MSKEDDGDDKSLALQQLVESLYFNNQIPDDDFQYLIENLKLGEYEKVYSYLVAMGLDVNIIDNEKYNSIKNGKYKFLKDSDNSLENEKIKYWSRKRNEFKEKNIDLISEINNKDKIIEQIKQENNIILTRIATFEGERKSFISKLNSLSKENNELKHKIQQKRIDEKIPEYVEDVSEKLDDADFFFTKMSKYWSIAGIFLAMLAVIAAFCTFIYGLETISDIKNLTPTAIAYTFIRGGIGIALLSWISYISFSNARNYTHESILRKDRQHALTFGRLFLQIYGSTATKEDAITVFKDWNMSGDTAFSSKSKTPPNPLSSLNSLKNSIFKQNDTKSHTSKTTD